MASRKKHHPPGTISYLGKRKAKKAKINIIDYSKDSYVEEMAVDCESCYPFKDKPSVTWIQTEGLHDRTLIERIGIHFNIHPLVLEDITNTEHRPKWEEFEDYTFVTLKMLFFNEKKAKMTTEQVSFVLGKNWVLSFQEGPDDVFDHVKERIKTNKGRIRRMGPDYLVYRLMDAIIDIYFDVLEKVGVEIERLEDELIKDPDEETMHKINRLKKEMVVLQRSIWPLREVIGGLQRSESELVAKATIPFFNDLFDHTAMVMESIESYQSMVFDMSDMYISSMSNKMNEIMKILTIIATIFIPLSFLASVYGINSQNMPELQHPLFYPYLWWFFVVLMIAMMLVYFRRKRWI